MKPKERVLAALNHQATDRVPVDITHGQIFPQLEGQLRLHFGVKDTEAVSLALGADLRWINPIYRRPAETLASAEQVNWFGASDGLLTYADGVGVRPLQAIESVAEAERYPWPNADWFDYGSVATLATQYASYAVVAPANWNPTFCRICELCGMEQALVLLLDKPAVIDALVERMHAFYLDFYRRVLDAAPGLIDIMYIGDDPAGQSGLLISPEIWRRHFKKPLGRIFALAKARGLRVMVHMCGAAHHLVPDLLDIGMDILMPLQFSAVGMDARRLKAEYGRDLCFYGGIDIQHTLPYGTPEQVRAEVRERAAALGVGGGYILGPAHSLLDDVPVANVLALYDEARSAPAPAAGEREQ